LRFFPLSVECTDQITTNQGERSAESRLSAGRGKTAHTSFHHRSACQTPRLTHSPPLSCINRTQRKVPYVTDQSHVSSACPLRDLGFPMTWESRLHYSDTTPSSKR
jgi:hypothetical protein